MPRLIQIIAVTLLLLATRPVQAFSLLGPLSTAPGGEAWQTPALGYNPLNSDIGSPKNRGEEYRWNTPIITYGFDNSFIEYFGTNGVGAVDDAFAILNSLPNLDSLTDRLDEFPLGDPMGAPTTFRDSRMVNFRAQANNLVDMKSLALGIIVEELGLANPMRWSWALRDRRTFGNPPVTNYLVIQRNFDPVTYMPTPYVNGNRYTYEIREFDNPAFADAVERPIDPEDTILGPSAVAAISGRGPEGALSFSGLNAGVFYTYLTQDDIGGLRYLYSTNNINVEPFPPNTQILAPDRSSLVSITNQDLTLFSMRSLFSGPELMSNFYPGLIINQAIPGPLQLVSNYPVIVTQTVNIHLFTNRTSPVILSNIDLTTFSSFARTSSPAALLAAYPNLIITSTNFSSFVFQDIESIVLTNGPKDPWGDPFQTNFIFVTNFVNRLGILYDYTFANVITNYASTVNRVRQIITGIQKEPWSDALNPIYRTNIQDVLVSEPSGGILIVPTNVFRYEFIPGFTATNVFANTNILFLTNVTDVNGLTRTISNIEYRFFTNVQYGVYPIEFLTNDFVTNILVTTTNVTTNIVTFDYEFGNVITNYSGPNTPATRVRVEVIPSAINPVLNQTNVLSSVPEIIPVPSGGFIIDTNQTGFEIVASTTNIILVTNVVFDVTDPNTGRRTVEQLVYNFTNVVYQVFPFVLQAPPAAVLRPGVGELTFRRIGGTIFTGTSFLFTNRYTATFITNGVLRSNVFQQVQTLPDILFSAADLGTLADSVRPIQYARSANFVNNAALNSTVAGQGGPGTINGIVNITFNKVGPTLINQFPGFVTEESALEFDLIQPFVFGRFDGSTNAPIVFPQDRSQANSLEQIELIITGGAVP